MFDRKLPLWYQLAQIVRGEILGGQLAAGARVAPEVELARRYGVSVVTVRQALRSLEEEALISRQRGRGTFVAPDPHRRQVPRLMGSAESVIAQQAAEETVVLEQRVMPVPPAVAVHFDGEREVHRVRCLRRDQGVPLNHALDYVLPEYGSQIGVKLLERAPMLTILRDVLGVKLSHVQIAIEAQRATREVAEPLGLDVMSPVLLVTAVVFDARHRAVDVAQIHYGADRFALTLDLDVSR